MHEGTYGRQGGTGRLVLERRLIHTQRVVLGLGRDRRRCRVVVWGSTIAACIAVEVVSVVKTLLRWLGRERQARDVRS